MSPFPQPPQTKLSALARYGCMLGAALASGALHVGLLGAFDRASPSIWLQPNSAVLLAQERCDHHSERGERTRCKQQAVQRSLAALQRPPTVASR